MKKYLAVFVAPPEAYDKMKSMSPEDSKAEMDQWNVWMEAHKEHVVDPGAPVGSAKRVNSEGVTDMRNTIGGYMIVQAETHEEAARIFEDSPSHGMEDGAIDVMEIVEM
ncbi:hypothetical protein KTR10_01080 [Candidatus Kaiserbacteria bacterium]|nr:hypothetical protein [Candidatus Kaiserbacteria bacterium]